MTQQTPQLTLAVTGMDCAHCALTVENGVKQLPGVTSCTVSFASEQLVVTGAAPRAAIEARVRELGYDIAHSATPPPRPTSFLAFIWSGVETRLALIAAILMLPGLFLTELGGISHWTLHLLAVVALALAGYPVARSGWRGLRFSRTLNINALMTIAAVGALLIGAYTEAAMVMVLFAIGEALEGFTADRARAAIRSFVNLTPKEALRLTVSDGNGRQESQVVPVTALHRGDRILVKPGALIPMDGRVVSGASTVNQAPITGESMPVDVTPSSTVFAGSINGDGALELEVTGVAADNTLSRIIELVREAQDAQAPMQRLVDRFAAIYTPAVVLLALLVAVIPPLFFGQSFANPGDGTFGWLYRGLALLVVACPCALVISTPVAIISAISNAARHGILIKGGAVLERLPAIRTIALDKTGTATTGAVGVVRVAALGCTSTVDDRCAPCDELMALASALEERSEHPLARAVVAEAALRGVSGRYAGAVGVSALGGRGVRGRVDGRDVVVGSQRFFEELHPLADAHRGLVDEEAAAGRTPVIVSADGHYLGVISLADAVRDSAAAAVEELRALGVTQITLLTGDHSAAAHSVAAALAIDDVRAGMLPADKIAAVRGLKIERGAVAMVGDGINDAPALAAADVGIALGGAHVGTAQAMETADITIMSDDLRRLPQLFRLARAALSVIRVNIVFSIAVKTLFVLLVLAGYGTMWMAVLADMGTSLLVTLNGMRLLGRNIDAR